MQSVGWQPDNICLLLGLSGEAQQWRVVRACKHAAHEPWVSAPSVT